MTVNDYHRIVKEMQELFLAVQTFKKQDSDAYIFSVLQTLFLLFASMIFIILHTKMGFIKELTLLPMCCMAIKDMVQAAKVIFRFKKII